MNAVDPTSETAQSSSSGTGKMNVSTKVGKVRPGQNVPLGATWDGRGVNFAFFSEAAEGVDVCLFDKADSPLPNSIIRLGERTDHIWHAYIPGLAPGQRYACRVRGTYDPASGRRFNASKLLLDPYAKAIEGQARPDESIFSYRVGGRFEDLRRDNRSNAAVIPKSIVIDRAFEWGDDRPPRIPWSDTIVYELHVKGFTALHPKVPESERGTYIGLGSEPAIEHLKKLGVTAVELMPVHHSIAEAGLITRGLTNYWGYSTVGFFAPDSRFSSRGSAGQQVGEFKEMVKRLHAAGIEVILDVVYNHTAEGNHLGPTLCFRGIDNSSYYRLRLDDRRFYTDFTGCGNTLNVVHPAVLRLIMDSLRYWILEMHVDGFRFDLATTLARGSEQFDRFGNFLSTIGQDPVLNNVKLIAEPWDLGDGGYRLGGFLPGWSEWNGRFRDCVRDYWRGADQTLAEFASRFTGSSDLFEGSGREPCASINFVTAHDGFTLRDLVSYNDKHNEANGEDNRDGEGNNRSWNCGVEGASNDPEVVALRARQVRNLLVSLLLSQGVPMILAGDEIGRTQHGNNNAYCQDNELSWLDWNAADSALFEYTRSLVALRKKHRTFRRRSWFRGRPLRVGGTKDIEWFRPDGTEMSAEDWNVGFAKSLGVYLGGRSIPDQDADGRRVLDATFYVIFNAHYEALDFVVPDLDWGKSWQRILDTATVSVESTGPRCAAGTAIHVGARSTVILRRVA
jgi:glycogen operon protein